MTSDKSFYNRTYSSIWRFRGFADLLRVSETIKYKEISKIIASFRETSGQPLKILDFGCGRGRLVHMLKGLGEITGVDFSTSAVEQCGVNFPFAKFDVVDVTDMAWAEEHKNTFNVVISVDVIEHLPWEKQDIFISNISTLCSSDGLVIITTPIRERTLEMKRDKNVSDEDFLKLIEGQPTANQLYLKQLTDLMTRYFKIISFKEVSPLIKNRFVDLFVKSISLPLMYKPMQILTNSFNIKGKYSLLALKPLRKINKNRRS